MGKYTTITLILKDKESGKEIYFDFTKKGVQINIAQEIVLISKEEFQKLIDFCK